MLESLDAALAKRRSGVVVFALIDLDGFARSTIRWGVPAATPWSKISPNICRPVCCRGRRSGRFEEDEFAAIISSDEQHAAELRRSSAAGFAAAPDLHGPDVADHRRHRCRARRRTTATTADELARRAGLALRAAKRDGRGTVDASSRRSKPTTPSGGSSCMSSSPPSRCSI